MLHSVTFFFFCAFLGAFAFSVRCWVCYSYNGICNKLQEWGITDVWFTACVLLELLLRNSLQKGVRCRNDSIFTTLNKFIRKCFAGYRHKFVALVRLYFWYRRTLRVSGKCIPGLHGNQEYLWNSDICLSFRLQQSLLWRQLSLSENGGCRCKKESWLHCCPCFTDSILMAIATSAAVRVRWVIFERSYCIFAWVELSACYVFSVTLRADNLMSFCSRWRTGICVDWSVKGYTTWPLDPKLI